MKIIRSDTLKINANAEQRKILDHTLNLYQAYVRDLMLMINAQWLTLGQCEGNAIIKRVEGLTHPTSKRPTVKYRYFHQKYYKFPSYLRRVAIMDATGQVRSFYTRFNQWLDGERKHANSNPPKLTCATSTFPSLYQGQCIRFNDSGSAAFIKVHSQNDWIWMAVPLSGKRRFKGTSLSPLLVKKGNKWQLSVPCKMDVTLKKKAQYSGKVLAVDVGINTAAACSVVDQHGTVHDRFFIGRKDKDREAKLMQTIRTKAKKQTRHGSKLDQGFCSQDHRRLKQLANNEAHQISRQIVNRAIAQRCDAVVVENLKGWRPKAGRKRSSMKAKFHRWFHRLLVDRIGSKAQEVGLRILSIYARGTSSNAYDGSGKVKRDKTNYANAQFASGKKYNADLSASYNIAARGLVRLYYPLWCKQQWSRGKPNVCPTTGSPWVLSSLWLLSGQKAG